MGEHSIHAPQRILRDGRSIKIEYAGNTTHSNLVLACSHLLNFGSDGLFEGPVLSRHREVSGSDVAIRATLAKPITGLFRPIWSRLGL